MSLLITRLVLTHLRFYLFPRLAITWQAIAVGGSAILSPSMLRSRAPKLSAKTGPMTVTTDLEGNPADRCSNTIQYNSILLVAPDGIL